MRHADAVAGVEARAAHLGEIPAGPEIARAPFGIGLEAARGEHHRLGGDVEAALALADMDADDAALVEQQAQHAGAVMDGDAVASRRLVLGGDETGPAAGGLDREPAPEARLVADLEGLTAIGREKFDPLAAQPDQRLETALDQQLREVGVAAILGDAAEIVVELLARIGAVIGARDFRLGELGDELLQILDAVVDGADGAGGEAAVAAALILGRALQHHHRGALLARRQRRRQRRIAGAHNHHVAAHFRHGRSRSPGRTR